MKCSMLPQPVYSLKLMLNLLSMTSIQVRELYYPDSIKYTFNMYLHFYVCEQVSFKLGMIKGDTKLLTFIPVSMTSIFIQGYSVTGKL